jgi:uncharacterized protein
VLDVNVLDANMIDVNVHLSRWPFRRVAGDEPRELVAMLRRHGVTQAWAGSFDALLHKDMNAVNERLAADCAASKGFLVPFGALNPMLPDWQEDLRRIADVHHMKGIRLYPNYHRYTLSDAIAAAALAAAAKRSLRVQIVLAMEDERTQSPLVRVPPVDIAPVPSLLSAVPGLQLMLLNAARPLPRLAGVFCDFAMQESPYAVRHVLSAVGEDRTVLGSHAPLFYMAAAGLKLKEGGLSPDQVHSITVGNAQRFLSGSGAAVSS